MFQRQYERVSFDTEATLCFADYTEYVCNSLDVSLGGMKVTQAGIKKLYGYMDEVCIIRFAVKIVSEKKNQDLVIQTKARVVNADSAGIGLKFEGVDGETLVILEKLVSGAFISDDLSVLEKKGGVSVTKPYTKILKEQLEEHMTEAVKEIFIAFLAIDVTPGPYVERPEFDAYAPPDTDVTGIVLFNGGLEGGVHVACPLHFAIKAAGAMLGEAGLELAETQPDEVWDAFGEITNQIAGGVQTRMSSSFDDINLTAPNVVIGPNIRVNYNKHFSSVRKFFKTPLGPFFVECFFS